MRIVAISDTHNMQDYINQINPIPDGDMLIHSGDSSMGGSVREVARFLRWVGHLKFAHKIIIAGNHDFCYNNINRGDIEKLANDLGIIYLRDSGIEINDVRFYGSPWTPFFNDWAFNLERGGDELVEKWALIPEDTNVLITHGPPQGIMDMTKRGDPAGCEILLKRAMQLKQLKYHIFGHIHEGYGVLEKNGITFVNAATCTARYAPTNVPIVIEIK